jgi:multidrug efflux pump subunit AcrB
VDHYQIQRTIDVYVAPRGEDLSRIYAGIQKIIDATQLPPNMKIEVRGSVQAMRDSFRSFAIGLTLSVILVYLILVAQFRSFLDPFLILLAVPPGLTGVLLILFLTNTPISVMALMGMLLMVGISVSDSILIVEFINRLRREGRSLREAVSLGPRVRLRPVLMTTLATLIGLIPMAAKLGTGGEAYAPLARALIGGLAVSALQTIFLVPACYYLFYRRKEAQPSPVLSGPESEALA